MSKPDTSHGHVFEQELHEAFKHMYMRFPVRWGRVMDTAGAGNIIGKAEADFRLMVASNMSGNPFMFHIEAKATIRPEICFEKNYREFVKPHQNAAMVMSVRAGATGIYLFKRVYAEEFEVWNSSLIGDVYPHKRTAVCGVPAGKFRTDKDSLARFAEYVCTNPADFLLSIRSTRP